MNGAIHPLPQYAFMAWCLVKAQGQLYLYLYLTLWKPKFHYRVLKSPPLIPILSKINPVHTHTIHFIKIYLNIIFQSTPFPQVVYSFFSGFPTERLVLISHLPMCATCRAHLTLLDFITFMILGEEYEL
jgi:hypothetical protein